LRRRSKDARPGAPSVTHPKRLKETPSAVTTAENPVLSPPTVIDSDALASESTRNAEGGCPQQLTESDRERGARAFWGLVISEELEKASRPEITLTPEEDADLFQKAAERVLLPKKVKRLEQALEQKDREIEQLTLTIAEQRRMIKQLKGRDASRATLLSHIVHFVKSHRRTNNLALSERLIASDADKLLKKRDAAVRLVCPRSWLKTPNLPLTLSGCLNHGEKKLRQNAKTLISRA
jgi:hypothetical protein